MAKFDSPLNNLKVASPCSQDWNAMIGNDRQRYCGDCKLNVFNLSGMSKTEAENLIMNAEGRLCVRFYKRADGSVITEDCPVGWARVKQRTKAYVTAFASLIFAFFGALGLVTAIKKPNAEVVGAIPVASPKQTPYLMGDISMPNPEETPVMMGGISPANTREENEAIMGKVAPKESQQPVKIEKRKN